MSHIDFYGKQREKSNENLFIVWKADVLDALMSEMYTIYLLL